MRRGRGLALLGGAAWLVAAGSATGAPLHARVVDATTGRPLPARVYVEGPPDTWHFVRSEAAEGSAVVYQRRSFADPRSLEMHTTVSAHPFTVELPPGRYTLTVERGKEYLPETRAVTVGDRPGQQHPAQEQAISMAK